MTLIIGRIPAIAEPMTWQNQGDQVSIMGRIAAGSATAATLLREQLIGYDQNIDEPIIPLISSTDSRLTGYYRILNVTVPSTTAMYLANGVIEYTITAQRMPGFSGPLMESTLIGGLIPNNFSVLAATVQMFATQAAAMTSFSTGTTLQSNGTRVADDGTLRASVLTASTFKALARGALPAASFYTNAAQIQAGLLTTPYPVIGRQLAPAIDDWRLTNGLIRVQSSASHDGLRLSFYTGAVWGALKTFTITFVNATSFGEGPTLRILRNAPEEVVVRMTLSAGALNYGPVYMDIFLRRGDRVLRCYLSSASADQWGLTTGGNPASTAITAGTKQTAADGDGNKIVLTSSGQPGTETFTTACGIVGATTVTTFDFGIGVEVSGAPAGSVAQDLVYQYLCGQAESQRVVVR